MAKKGSPERPKRDKSHPIDHIPDYKKQPRGSPPKRRTDFSFFSHSSAVSSLSNPGGYLRPGSSMESIISSDESKGEVKEFPEILLLRNHTSSDERSRPLSDVYDVPTMRVEPVAQNAIIDPCSDSQKEGDTALTLESSSKKMQVKENNGVCIARGNVVWAKTASQVWWPAEIIGEEPSLADLRSQDIYGHVYVQFYGNHLRAWVDPATDLSEFENCFEERSCNSMQDFQGALKEAMKKKEDLSSHAHLLASHDGPKQQDQQQDQSSDKYASSVSSRSEVKLHKRRKGTRERRPNIRFHEVTFAEKPARHVRRFRIMRYLGLIAPIGSPF